ncbi:mechanosensitive ion channel family protein [Pseudoalteromonas ardens]|uniref:Transporter n=1 Tax=Pseudoalteromonas rubra TaxID=43658 RepID=A0A0L0EVS2_9GAMM|nr:mechanosensitive ion channel domain-containing protein [Pseudoalteromonas sp. R96]KNC68504.1 transporter [Pseudoalteromonas rubra]MDK1314302.1 mechanosensitive ion channel [Pseudoalteromonas sp. R96]
MKVTHLSEALTPWLGASSHSGLLIWGTNILALVILLLVFWLIRQWLLPRVQQFLSAYSNSKIGFLAPQLSKFSGRFSMVVCTLLFIAFKEALFLAPQGLFNVMSVVSQGLLIISIGFLLSSLVNIVNAIYDQQPFAKSVPIQSLVQVSKLLIFIVCAILVISLAIDKSPTYILSGFGAIAAVTLLVFKDTILGLVASIQIAANRLLATGDWIQVDAFGADGEVIEVGLNTVRVRNWDNTVTTIPTYKIISDSFKNWRAMQESNGRRIKRAIYLDFDSIRLLSQDELTALSQALPEVAALLQDTTVQRWSNVSVFRRYAETYLKAHPQVNSECLCMVRELAPTQYGLPVELYCFSRDKRWVQYEHLQADVLDHILTVMPYFGLRPYQVISSHQNEINHKKPE